MKKLSKEMRELLLWIVGQPNKSKAKELLERAQRTANRISNKKSKEAKELEQVISLSRDFWRGKRK